MKEESRERGLRKRAAKLGLKIVKNRMRKDPSSPHYKGYHLLAEASTTAGEGEEFSLTVTAGEERFALGGEIAVVQGGEGGSTRIRVRLSRAAGSMYQGKVLSPEMLLTTGLTVPLGQTVVLGSAAPGGGYKALVLAVRPEVAIPPRR